MDCTYADWIALEFDHRDPKEKYEDISKLMKKGYLGKLKEEIKKCDIVCANCHTRRTARQFGSWRLDDK
jgi:hypothetical protein